MWFIHDPPYVEYMDLDVRCPRKAVKLLTHSPKHCQENQLLSLEHSWAPIQYKDIVLPV